MIIDVITSAANPLLKEIRKAQEQGGLTANGWMIAEGPHLVEEAVRSGLRIHCLIVSEGADWNAADWNAGELNGSAIRADRLVQLQPQVYRSISGTNTPQGVLALVRPPVHKPESIYNANSLVVVLDGVQDPGNAGTVIRSAEAFGASGAILLGATAHPMNPKTLRSSAGSLFRVPYLRQRETLSLEPGLPLFAGVADPSASAAWDCNLAQSCAIVIGNEGAGVSGDVRKRAQPVRIPTSGVESLNAGVAASILLYEAARQRRLS